MTKLLKVVTTVMLLISIVLTLSVSTAASSFDLASIPDLSSTICPYCGIRMQKTGQDIEEYYKYVNTCANAPNAITPHRHNFRRYYDVYECSNCGTWGRRYVKTTMQCVVSQNPYSWNPYY